MRKEISAKLILEDGTEFDGFSFGSDTSVAGEAVFNTAMTGYPESLTDPSYEGQILVTTFPLLGNYGVPPARTADTSLSEYYEGDRIHCRAIVAQDYSWQHSHWLAARSLSDWLKEQGVAGIYGVDTRALAKHLRDNGSMLGKVIIGDENPDIVDWYDPNKENLVAKTSCAEVKEYAPDNGNPDAKTVVLVDCGVKHNIVRCLTRRGVKVVRVPWDFDFTAIPYDGLFISNGPGNPEFAEATVGHIRKAMEIGKPICGICMGNQLLAKAAGASTYKLKYGHRSHNQPVRQKAPLGPADEGYEHRCFVTSQNHGFAVDQTKLPDDWTPLFVNMNDGTNEGIRHKTKPFFSAQFHPEASSGPKDTEFLFDKFIELL